MATKKVRGILVIGGGLLSVFLSCRNDGSTDAARNRDGNEIALGFSDKDLRPILGEESVEYAKHACQKLDIVEPIQVTDAAGYWDGGSRALMLRDSRNIDYEFTIWHKFLGPMDISRSDRKGKPERVELAGPEERDLYGVMLRWILAHPRRDALLGKEDIDPVKDNVLHETCQFYFRMKRRIIPEEAWTNFGPKPIDRSWIDGTMNVSAAKKDHETRIFVCGSWRDAKPGHKVRYNIWSIDKEGQESIRYQRTRPLESFKDEIAGFYPSGKEPYRLACDYEIWEGEPGKGRLLAKNSVFSIWYNE